MALHHENLPVNWSSPEPSNRLVSRIDGLPIENPFITEEDRMRQSKLSEKAKNIIRRAGRVIHSVTEDAVNYGVFLGTTAAVKLAEKGVGSSSRVVEIAVPSAITLVEAYALTRIATDRLVPPINKVGTGTGMLSAAKVAGETALHGISWITGTPTVVSVHDEAIGHSDMAMRQRLAASFAGASVGLYIGLGALAETLDNPWIAPVGLGIVVSAAAGLDHVAGNYFRHRAEVISGMDK